VTLALWIVASLALAGVLALGVVLAETLRQIDRLRAEVSHRATSAPGGVPSGLPAGAPAPAFRFDTAHGRLSSTSFAGRRHVILFASPGCAPCERVVPTAARLADAGRIPDLIVVSRGEPGCQPAAWTGRRPGAVTLGTERGDAVSSLFDTAITPHAFVVGADGHIVAQGIASDPDHLLRLAGAAGDAREATA
jgi:thiol-disulfide isomerase/thioredoxin